MWRVVCIGPSPLDQVRRVVDKGPLHPDHGRVNVIATQLRATGLYESVTVEGSAVKSAVLASPERARGGGQKTPAPEKPLDELPSALEGEVTPPTAPPTDGT